MLKSCIFTVARFGGINALLRARTGHAFRIVTYHGVDEQDHAVVNFDRLQVEPGHFCRQIESLARAYRIVSLREALEGFLSGRGWPKRGLAITFDDGYRNNLIHAAPVLQRIGVPATFFLTAGFVEGRVRAWWYDLREAIARAHSTELLLPGEPARDLRTMEAKKHCCRALEWAWAGLPDSDRRARLHQLQELCQVPEMPMRYPFLNVEQARRLAGLGFDLEPHGDTHCSLRAESEAKVATEVSASVAFIRSLTGRDPQCLAWPYGHHPATRALMERVLGLSGVPSAVSVATGFNEPDADRFALYRWDVHGGYSLNALQARLSGFSSKFRTEPES